MRAGEEITATTALHDIYTNPEGPEGWSFLLPG